MEINWLVTGLAALIPMLIGMLWYSKMLFGTTWMRINRFREEDMKGANMAIIFGFTLLFSFMIAMVMNGIVIHQFTLYSLVGGEATTPADKAWLESSMSAYGSKFRTFRHGLLHGSIASLFFALPIIGIPALFERRGWKYILIHFGYWLVTLALMGAVICQWT
jgi:hypothetical protein